MRIGMKLVMVLSVVGLVAAGPLGYAYHFNSHLRNFHVVQEGVLYRSGQLTPDALDQVVSEHNIRTVVSLRTTRVTGKLPPDTWEEDFCAARGIKHVRIVPRIWGANEKGEIPAEQAVQEFLQVMDNPANHPVLVHCFAGIHRTGTMCAIFRIEFQHWPSDRAINEMQLAGFVPQDTPESTEGCLLIEEYLRSYAPRWQHRK